MVLLALVTSPLSLPRCWARLGGCLFPSVTFFGPARERRIALTIDDGPDPRTTPDILAALDRLGVRATFFLIGERAEAAPQLVGEIRDRGHEVGHHMWRDRATARLSSTTMHDAAARTARVLANAGPIRWFRPGQGVVSKRILRMAEARGLRVVLGDLPAIDTHVPQPALVAAYLGRMARAGSIVTIHDFGPRGRRAVAILERVVPRWRRRGFEVGALGDLMGR